MATVVLVDDPKLAVIIQEIVDRFVEYNNDKIEELEAELEEQTTANEKLQEAYDKLIEKVGK